MRFGFGFDIAQPRQSGMADPIAALYGAGLGQIPLHLRPEDAVMDAQGNMIRIPNKGGAGALFSATANGTGITRSGILLDIPAASYAALSTVVDLVGTRLFMVVRLGPGIAGTRRVQFAGRSAGSAAGDRAEINYEPGLYFGLSYYNGATWTGIASSPVSVEGSLCVIEIEAAAQLFRVWHNGVFVSSVPQSFPTFLLSRVWGVFNNSAGFQGQAGDVVSMVTDGSAAMDAPATTIRRVLAAKHGIALP